MTAPPWLALLALLPDDAVPRRQPIAPPDVLETPAGAAIAGWHKLVLDLSAGALGLRIVLVVCDQSGKVIGASDAVLVRSGAPDSIRAEGSETTAEIHQESIGGSFDADGTFRGTRWTSVGSERAEGEIPEWDSTPSEPSTAEVAALRALIAQVMERRPPRT